MFCCARVRVMWVGNGRDNSAPLHPRPHLHSRCLRRYLPHRQNAQATTDATVAIGCAALATSAQAVALGPSANASAGNSTAIGFQASATGLDSIAIGHGGQ